jgi:hypothetical protein
MTKANGLLVKFALRNYWADTLARAAVQEFFTEESRVNRGAVENFLLDNAKHLTNEYRKSAK